MCDNYYPHFTDEKNGGTESLSNFPKTPELENGRARFWI